MSISENFAVLKGEWKGTNRLHTPWMPVKVHESDSSANVLPRINGQFLEIAYNWVYEGNTQEGILLLGGDNATDAVKAFWTDSWHMAHQTMMCEGKTVDNGRLSVKGYYKVADHPDWGWRTEIVPGEGSFSYLMYNVTPEGVEELAVETEFVRV